MTPEQEEQVRRALEASARGDGADHPRMPDDVAARLDDVLAELVEAREPGRSGAADALAARRPRRWPNLLVAAAAICAIALAGAAVVTGGFGSSGGSGALSGNAAGDTSAEKAGPDAGGPALVPGSSAQAGGTEAPVPRLRTDTLAEDLRAVAAGESTLRAPADTAPAERPGRSCTAPPRRAGDTVLAVRLDGRPATLVLAAPRDGARVARVYSCDGSATVLASAPVPVG